MRLRYCLPLGLIILTLFASAFASPCRAAPACPTHEHVLWGDGRHDDTAALNAWFLGEPAYWGQTGAAVGVAIAGHAFLLSGPLYVSSGTGRRLAHFRLWWPGRHETILGGAIDSGSDPERAPLLRDIVKTGGDPGEGVPFEGPDPAAATDRDGSACPIS